MYKYNKQKQLIIIGKSRAHPTLIIYEMDHYEMPEGYKINALNQLTLSIRSFSH